MGGHPVYGSATINMKYGAMEGGDLLFNSNSFINMNGDRNTFYKCLENRSYSIMWNILGGIASVSQVVSHSNSSADFMLSVSSSITLMKTNGQFLPVINHYFKYGLLTGILFLAAALIYYYRRSRKWTTYQSLFFAIFVCAILTVFILPVTYTYYFI